MSGIQEASMRSIRPYRSSEQYLYAMKEDLAEWLTELYGLEVDAGSFLAVLETGSVLCHHANNITQVARDFSQEYPNLAHKVHLPTCGVTCNESAQPGTFQARDNVSNFIQWCRKEMDIKEVLMFETEDLVLRKNEKHFVLCLLEVARRASRFGMSAPILIQMEEEIEEEIREDLNLPPEETPLPRPQKQPCNFKNLDQMVQHLVSRCTCPVQFSMIKVSEGKYRVGNSSTLIFVRILRNHVMVRVGGGWDTLEHYLDKHDPCRCTSLSHKQAMRTTSLQRTQAAQVQHEITARLTPRVDSPNKPQPALIVSRSQSPLPPVEWRTYTAHKALSTSPPNSRGSLKKTPGVQMSWDHSEPRRVPLARVRERSATPSRRLPAPEEKSASKPSAQSGKEMLQDPFCYQQKGSTNSYASKALPEPPRRRETQRIQTAELQKEKAKSLPPSVTEVPRDHSCQPPRNAHQEVKIRPSSPSKHFGPPPAQQASKTQVGSSSGLEEGAAGSPALRKAPLTKRSPSPVKQAHQLPKEESSPRTSEKARPTFSRPPTPSRSYQRRVCFRNGDHAMPKDLLCGEPATKDVAGSEMERGNVVRWETFAGQFPDSSRDRICRRDSRQKIKDTRTLLKEEEAPKDPCGDCEGDHRHPKEKGRVYTPLPIDLAEEKALYQTLEEEILANIKELEADSCGNHQLKENEVKEYRIECGLRKDTLAFGCNGPRLSTHTLSCLPSAKALGYGEGVPRSGVYVPHHNAKWPPVGFYYDSVIQELSRTLRRERVETEKNSPQLSSSLLNGDQAERMVLERVTIHTEKFVATESEGNRPNTHEGQVEVNRNGRVSEHEVTSDKTHSSPESVLENSKLPQNRPRRTLKKPERVPSIYKLKLRPKMRPRRDNRPDRRPSKIPKPVAYRHAQRASSAKAQAKSHSSKCLTQNSLTHTRQNSTGNGGCVEEVPPSQCSPSSTYSRDSGTKRATPKEKTGLTDDEESWV